MEFLHMCRRQKIRRRRIWRSQPDQPMTETRGLRPPGVSELADSTRSATALPTCAGPGLASGPTDMQVRPRGRLRMRAPERRATGSRRWRELRGGGAGTIVVTRHSTQSTTCGAGRSRRALRGTAGGGLLHAPDGKVWRNFCPRATEGSRDHRAANWRGDER